MWSNLILPSKNTTINTKYLDNLVSMINSCYTKDELYSIYQYIDIKHINSSLITEGTWSTYDTTSLIMSGVMPNNIEYRAFMECNNLCLAIKYVMNNLRNNVDLNEDILFNLHSILGHGLSDKKIPLYMQLIRDGQEVEDRVNVAYMKFIYDIELEIMQNIYSGNQI